MKTAIITADKKAIMIDLPPRGVIYEMQDGQHKVIVEGGIPTKKEPIQEARGGGNPYHDSLGRFATGPGGQRYVTLGFEELEDSDQYITTATWSDQQKQAVEDYMDFGFENTNKALRVNKGNLQKIANEDSYRAVDIQSIDGSMKSALKQNTVLFRGLSMSSDIAIGSTLRDHGFNSTTFLKDKAVEFSDSGKGLTRYVVKIKAPKGTKGIFGPDISSSNLASEELEFILPRGTSYRITGKSAKRTRNDALGADYFELEAEVI